MEKWKCRCGTINDTKFCTNCGLPSEQGQEDKKEITPPQQIYSVKNMDIGKGINLNPQKNKKLAAALVLVIVLLAAYFGYGKLVEYRYESKCNEYIKVTADFKKTVSSIYDLTGDPDEEARQNIIAELKKEAEQVKGLQEYFISDRLPDVVAPEKDRYVNSLQKNTDVINDIIEVLSFDESIVGKNNENNSKKLKRLTDNTDKDCDKLGGSIGVYYKGQSINDLIDTGDIKNAIGNYCSNKYSADLKKWRENQNKEEEERKQKEQANILGSTAANEAAKTLFAYHDNISKKNYQLAYGCTSPNWQSHVGYDGWAAGFKTTVKSEVKDVKCASSSDDRVVLNYVLTAVDNPGGVKQFNGTAVIVKTNNGWKIDSMENKAK